MGKRGSGPGGPDRDPEPFEFEASETAQKYHSADCDAVQPGPDALLEHCGDALDGIDQDRIVYDSGWDDTADRPVRVVFVAGSVNQGLWEWVRRVAFARPVGEEVER